MKPLGGLLMVIAAIAALVGFTNLKETNLERLSADVVESSEDLDRFTRSAEKLVGYGSLPTSSLETSSRLDSARSGLSERRSSRERKSLIAFSVAGLFFIGGLICFASGGSPPAPALARTTNIVASTPPPLPPPPNAATLRVSRGGTDLGELPIESVQTMISTGLLAQEDYYWNAEAQEWRPLGELVVSG